MSILCVLLPHEQKNTNAAIADNNIKFFFIMIVFLLTCQRGCHLLCNLSFACLRRAVRNFLERSEKQVDKLLKFRKFVTCIKYNTSKKRMEILNQSPSFYSNNDYISVCRLFSTLRFVTIGIIDYILFVSCNPVIFLT